MDILKSMVLELKSFRKKKPPQWVVARLWQAPEDIIFISIITCQVAGMQNAIINNLLIIANKTRIIQLLHIGVILKNNIILDSIVCETCH